MYHSSISDALALLAQSIHLVIRNASIEEQSTSSSSSTSSPRKDDLTPTSAHMTLKAWINQLIEDVERTSAVEPWSLLPTEVEPDVEMYFAESYEDLLATAIINRVNNENAIFDTRVENIMMMSTCGE